jgi:hypothetical protein
MGKLRTHQLGFSGIEGLLVIVLVAMLGFVGWYVWHSGQTASQTLTPVITTVEQNKTDTTPTVTEKETIAIPAPVDGVTTFTGTVTGDTCTASSRDPHGPVGDVGCSLQLGDTVVAIVHGNASTPEWGSLIGFKSSTDITGKKVEVHAVQNSTNQFSLSRSDAYVKLLN